MATTAGSHNSTVARGSWTHQLFTNCSKQDSRRPTQHQNLFGKMQCFLESNFSCGLPPRTEFGAGQTYSKRRLLIARPANSVEHHRKRLIISSFTAPSPDLYGMKLDCKSLTTSPSRTCTIYPRSKHCLQLSTIPILPSSAGSCGSDAMPSSSETKTCPSDRCYMLAASKLQHGAPESPESKGTWLTPGAPFSRSELTKTCKFVIITSLFQRFKLSCKSGDWPIIN